MEQKHHNGSDAPFDPGDVAFSGFVQKIKGCADLHTLFLSSLSLEQAGSISWTICPEIAELVS
jgi:hypothetical protein